MKFIYKKKTSDTPIDLSLLPFKKFSNFFALDSDNVSHAWLCLADGTAIEYGYCNTFTIGNDIHFKVKFASWPLIFITPYYETKVIRFRWYEMENKDLTRVKLYSDNESDIQRGSISFNFLVIGRWK